MADIVNTGVQGTYSSSLSELDADLDRTWYNPGAFNNGFKGFCSVFVTAAFAFSGTELVGLAAAESRTPLKSLPSAVKQVFWRITLCASLPTSTPLPVLTNTASTFWPSSLSAFSYDQTMSVSLVQTPMAILQHHLLSSRVNTLGSAASTPS